MGYESRFYVVDKSSFQIGNQLYYANIIAMFDMSKMGYDSKTLTLVGVSPDANCYVYADDGNTQIVKDRYDKKLTDVDFGALIKCLKSDDDGSRRIKPFLAFLEGIDTSQWDGLRVLHFGY